MRRAPMPHACRSFLDDFSAFIDGGLVAERRDEHQAHVDCCQACLEHLAAYRRGITVLRSIEEDAPADFWVRLERRLWLGPELAVVDGDAGSRPDRRTIRWPRPAVGMAAAAVLALFVIARGLGPGTGTGEVGPTPVGASVAMTVPEVPPSETATPAADTRIGSRNPAARRAASARTGVATPTPAGDPAAAVLARVESGPTPSFEQELRRIREAGLRQPLGRASGFAADGWVEPVRLGPDWSRASIVPASLSRSAASVTPAPWNVGRAVSLP